MARLVTLYDLQRDGGFDLRGEGVYDPTGEPVLTSEAGRVGTVRGALVDEGGGHKVRYLVVDASGRSVIVPIGYARIENDGIYLDGLSAGGLGGMHEYSDDEEYTYDPDQSDERRLGGQAGNFAAGERVLQATSNTADIDTASTTTTGSTTGRADFDMFQTPQRLQLLEERLAVSKERVHTGTVEVGKHVETRTEQVPVTLTHEEVVIERHPVTPTSVGNVQLGSGSETIRVDLEAERAEVRKQAFVTEEVTIGEREVSETQTFTETVGREVLDVNRTGDVTTGTVGTTGTTATRDDRNLLERAGDTISEGVDRLDGKNDR